MSSFKKSIEVYVDGGSRGNPGPAGGGYAVFQNGRILDKDSEYFGEKTNNQAEYLALRLALRAVYDKFGDEAPELNCFMDSRLVVEQMNGNYKVKSKNVKLLFQEVRRIADKFKSFTISHIPRAENYLADNLANQAMDRQY